MTERLVSDERIRQIAEQICRDATSRSDELGCGDIERAIRQAVQEAGEAAARVCDERANHARGIWQDYVDKCRENTDNIGPGSQSWHQYYESCAAEIRKRLPKPPE